jgi:hypothetical protein
MGDGQNSGGGGGGRTKQVDQWACEYTKTGTHTHTGHLNGPGGHESLAFEVLRALVKGRGGGWACAGGVCASVTATFQCDGHHSRVPVPRLEVQTSIRKRDRRCREGNERRHDTRAHGQERGGWCVTGHALLCVVRFFSRPESGVVYMDRRRRLLFSKEKRRRNNFVIGGEIIRIILGQWELSQNTYKPIEGPRALTAGFVRIAA